VLDQLIGPERIRASVDYYLSGDENGFSGAELAHGVLRHIRSRVALRYCYEIYTTSSDHERRINAVELLRCCADAFRTPELLDWIYEFLADPEPSIQNWGIGVVVELSYSDRIGDEDLKRLLNDFANHKSEYVREKVGEIRACRERYAVEEEDLPGRD
jgi:hypothetical protein